MTIKRKIFHISAKIVIESIPVLLMISLIVVFSNDFMLLGAYLCIISVAFAIKYRKLDGILFLFGGVVMTFSEYIFISTGVEIFQRNSLFGLMPIWLPFLWAYGFVVIGRSIAIIESNT